MDADGSNVHSVSRPDKNEDFPSFSPDGRQIVYVSEDDSLIYEMNVDGRNPHPLTNRREHYKEPHYSPDGKWIVYVRWSDLWPLILVMDRHGDFISDQTPTGSTQTGYELTSLYYLVSDPSWSPDGRYVAYAVNYYNTSKS